MQAGYGVWFGLHHQRNFSAHVPAHEWQSIRGGNYGGLHAMLSRAPGERMVVVLESEHGFKRITMIWPDMARQVEASWMEDGLKGGGAQGPVGAHPVAARGSKRPAAAQVGGSQRGG